MRKKKCVNHSSTISIGNNPLDVLDRTGIILSVIMLRLRIALSQHRTKKRRRITQRQFFRPPNPRAVSPTHTEHPPYSNIKRSLGRRTRPCASIFLTHVHSRWKQSILHFKSLKITTSSTAKVRILHLPCESAGAPTSRETNQRGVRTSPAFSLVDLPTNLDILDA